MEMMTIRLMMMMTMIAQDDVRVASADALAKKIVAFVRACRQAASGACAASAEALANRMPLSKTIAVKPVQTI